MQARRENQPAVPSKEFNYEQQASWFPVRAAGSKRAAVDILAVACY
jgi:hypothetical protein